MLRLAMARSLQLSRLTPSRVQVSMPEPSAASSGFAPATAIRTSRTTSTTSSRSTARSRSGS